MRAKRHLDIGTSGGHYDHSVEPFSPPGLPKRCWLSFYAERFGCVEVNSGFYGLPSKKTTSRSPVCAACAASP